MTALRLVPPPDVVCWPWFLRFMSADTRHPKGGECRACREAVAVPPDRSVAAAVCLYCAMDEGLIEGVDAPPY